MSKKSQNNVEKLFDKSFRNNLRNNPKKTIKDENMGNYDSDIPIKVVTNTKDKIYVVFSHQISLQDWGEVSAGRATTVGSIGSIGTASTVATMSTIGSTLDTMSTIGTTAGTASTAGTALAEKGCVQI